MVEGDRIMRPGQGLVFSGTGITLTRALKDPHQVHISSKSLYTITQSALAR